tara:strand:+ start:463 stop:603 length:141 start_codon:yes stop_codon:yes gene_type:complete
LRKIIGNRTGTSGDEIWLIPLLTKVFIKKILLEKLRSIGKFKLFKT